MEQHEMTAWLGDTEVTDEQRTALHRAADLANTRYGERDEQETALTAAAQIILGDDTLSGITAAYARARRAEREAMASLTGAIIAASATMSEVEIAKQTGVTRMTVRKALGK